MTAIQEDLFSHSRASDPSTSRDAASQVDLNARCAFFLAAIYRMRLSKPTFTDTDIAEATGEERGICARRRKDLVNRGLVEPVWLNGEQETRMGSRGRLVEVWMLTELGYVRGAEVSQ